MPDSVAVRIVLELIAIVGLVSLNGLFAFSEIAVVSAKRARLQQLAPKDRRAESVMQLADEPTAFLSTVQIGITLIGILAGALGGATLNIELSAFLGRVGWLSAYAEVISFSIVVLFVTLLSLLIGELIPKSIALSNPERFAMAVAPLMQFLARITAPIVALLSWLTNVTLQLLRIKPNEQLPITEEEIKTLLAEGAQAGIFEPLEKQIVTQALELDDISLQPILTHRTTVVWLNVHDPISKWIQTVAENSFRAFPICDGTMDRTLGVIRTRDLLLACVEHKVNLKSEQASTELSRNDGILSGLSMPPYVSEIVQPALFVPRSASPSSLLNHFRDPQISMIFAVDEYGGTEGIITQTDILTNLTE